MTKDRRSELLGAFEGIDDGVRAVVMPTVEEALFLEERLEELRELPFIRYNPNNPAQQKATPAAKQYKEFLQQYNNCVKILTGVLRHDVPEEESPLREWLKGRSDA